MLVEKYGEKLSTNFFDTIKKIKNNFNEKIGCFQENIEWKKFLTDRRSFDNNDLFKTKIKKITQLDAKAVALYNLYWNIVEGITYEMCQKKNKIVFFEEFACESVSFFNFFDEQDDLFFKQNNDQPEILSKEEIDASARLLAGLLTLSPTYDKYKKNIQYYTNYPGTHYNYWGQVGVFCDRYSQDFDIKQQEQRGIKKENQNFFSKNKKWFIAGLIIFSLSLYLLIKNQK